MLYRFYLYFIGLGAFYLKTMNDTFEFELFGERPSIAITTAQEQGITQPVGSTFSIMSLTQPTAPSVTVSEAEQSLIDKQADEISQLKEKEKEAKVYNFSIVFAIIGIGFIFLLTQK